MTDINNWSEVDDDNNSAAPAGAPENMPYSGVNNVIRAVMGAVKRWYASVESRWPVAEGGFLLASATTTRFSTGISGVSRIEQGVYHLTLSSPLSNTGKIKFNCSAQPLFAISNTVNAYVVNDSTIAVVVSRTASGAPIDDVIISIEVYQK